MTKSVAWWNTKAGMNELSRMSEPAGVPEMLVPERMKIQRESSVPMASLHLQSTTKGLPVESDKASMEIPSSHAGVVKEVRVKVDDKAIDVTGRAWMDREWSSQPLASDQTGWDWFSLHLPGDEKLMLYRLRQRDSRDNLFGNWIEPDGRSSEVAAIDNSITPTGFTDIGGRKVPTAWRVAIPARGLRIETTPLNPRSWMGTSFPYWEGPISFAGSHAGIGYLELTGY
jgi:predicted secreted hydrolase